MGPNAQYLNRQLAGIETCLPGLARSQQLPQPWREPRRKLCHEGQCLRGEHISIP